MKLLVFSDSHGISFPLREAMSRAGGADYAIHAGDGAPDIITTAGVFGMTPVAVRGNCDLGSDLPSECTLIVEDIRILVVHGHKFGVKSSLSPLIVEARRRGVDLVIFGHTHEKCEKYIPADENNGSRPLRLFNPGCARGGDFGVIEIRGGDVLMSHGNVYD